MVRIKFEELLKAIELLKKDSQASIVSIKDDGAVLKIGAPDKSGRDMVIELSDTNYPMMPKVTKTETF
jgi:hypothetical protein